MALIKNWEGIINMQLYENSKMAANMAVVTGAITVWARTPVVFMLPSLFWCLIICFQPQGISWNSHLWYNQYLLRKWYFFKRYQNQWSLMSSAPIAGSYKLSETTFTPQNVIWNILMTEDSITFTHYTIVTYTYSGPPTPSQRNTHKNTHTHATQTLYHILFILRILRKFVPTFLCNASFFCLTASLHYLNPCWLIIDTV